MVLEIQGIELAHRYAKLFRAYCETVVGQRPLLLEYGLTQEIQFLLHSELSAQLSTTLSFETVYKTLLVGDSRPLIHANDKFQLKYRDGLRAGDIYEADFEVDPQFLCFEDDQAFEKAVRMGGKRTGKAERQYLANLFGQ